MGMLNQNRYSLVVLLSLVIFHLPVAFATDGQCDSNEPEFLCDRLKDASGKIIKPSVEIKAILQAYSGKIKEVAKIYGVDPRAVTGALMAENSMNVTKDRTAAKNTLRMLGGVGNAAYKAYSGMGYSRGLGQIKPETAYAVEKMAAKIEGRTERTENQIEEVLFDNENSIKYAAAIIRNAQDTYKEQGIDISKDPGLLASVYNLGKAQSRAQKAKEEKKNPRYNYFGQFVAANTDAIDEVLNYKPLVKDGTNSSPFANGDLKTYAYPPDCAQKQDDGLSGGYVIQGTRDGYKDKSFNQPGPTGKLGGFYKMLDRSIDCNGATWILASGSNKSTGWVKESELNEHTTLLPKVKPTCNPNAVKKCLTEIGKATAGSMGQLGREANGTFAFRLNAQDNGKPVDIKTWQPECMVANKLTDAKMQQWNGVTKGKEITREQAAKYQNAIAQKREEIRALIGDDVDNKDFPLYDILHKTDLAKCGVTASCTHAPSYYGNHDKKELIEEFLALDMKKLVNSLNSLKETANLYKNTITVDDGSETSYGEAMKEVELQCGDLFNGDFKGLFNNSGYGYSSYTDWGSFKEYMKNSVPSSEKEKVKVQNVAETLSACARVRVHRSNYAITPACSNPLYRAAVEQTGANLTQFMKKALSSKEDQDQFLRNTVGWMSQIGPNRGNYGSYNASGVPLDCNYLPNKLEEDIDKIKNISCVEAILVPDLNVVRHYTSQGLGTVVQADFEKTDRYAVKIKEACND